MTYLERLKAEFSEKQPLEAPAKGAKGTFAGFAGGQSGHIQRKTSAAFTDAERALVEEWLEVIEETDPEARQEWLVQCECDPETLLYTVRRLAGLMLDLSGAKYVFRVVNPDTDPVRVVVAIRGNGTVDLLVPRSKWDGFLFMEMLGKQREAN